ncbi:MAG TPA: (Fe-S)-binding protein [Pyrinomonadaceae bacterium]|jgi:L-lactate dehydrogenase complex protein LldE
MRVSLFITCLNDQVFPQVGIAMVKTLRRLGVEVDFNPAQTCCGQPAFNTGYRKDARALAEHFIDVFQNERADFIVAPSGSCTAMVRNYYQELFHGATDKSRLRAIEGVRTRLREFSEFIVDELKVEDVGASFDGRVTYHDACHLLRELNISEGPRRLIRAVRGIDYVEMEAPDTCCGFGGTFSVKYAEISNAILEEKIARINRSGAQYVVANDSSCLMQIAGGLSRAGSPVKTMHLAELLAHA